MAFVALEGEGFWMPNPLMGLYGNGLFPTNDTLTMTATGHECQLIGRVVIDGGGPKTFGGGSSLLGWLPGAAITFGAVATLRVGVKTAVDLANGPAARATLGTAAFAVYDDLVGGTDTIASTTWREDAMGSGEPFAMSNGNLIALCWHLTVTSGPPNVKVQCATTNVQVGLPAATVVSAGPTYAAAACLPNALLKFSDGTLGWIDGARIFSTADVSSAAFGQNFIRGNVFTVPFACRINALKASLNLSTNAANHAFVVYGDPLGATPTLLASVAGDANVVNSLASPRLHHIPLPTPIELAAETPYFVGVQQTTATAVAMTRYQVTDATYFKHLGMGAECAAATSDNGATFVVDGTPRRHLVWIRVSHIDVGGAGVLGARIRSGF